MPAIKGFKKRELVVISSMGGDSQDDLRADLYPFMVELDKCHTEKVWVIDSLMSYSRSQPKDDVWVWLYDNLLGQYQLSSGRRTLVGFTNEEAMAFFRLAFACKPYEQKFFMSKDYTKLA